MASARLREVSFDPLVGGRAIIDGLQAASARPGAAVELVTPALMVRPARVRAACAVLLAMLDRDVSLAVVGPDAGDIGEYLRFNSGARRATVAAADFVLVTHGGTWPVAVDGGRPEWRRTVVLAPDGISAGAGTPTSLIVVGTGQVDTRQLPVNGIMADELAVIRAENVHAPSIDVWLIDAAGRLAVLPATAPWFPLPVPVPTGS